MAGASISFCRVEGSGSPKRRSDRLLTEAGKLDAIVSLAGQGKALCLFTRSASNGCSSTTILCCSGTLPGGPGPPGLGSGLNKFKVVTRAVPTSYLNVAICVSNNSKGVVDTGAGGSACKRAYKTNVCSMSVTCCSLFNRNRGSKRDHIAIGVSVDGSVLRSRTVDLRGISGLVGRGLGSNTVTGRSMAAVISGLNGLVLTGTGCDTVTRVASTVGLEIRGNSIVGRVGLSPAAAAVTDECLRIKTRAMVSGGIVISEVLTTGTIATSGLTIASLSTVATGVNALHAGADKTEARVGSGLVRVFSRGGFQIVTLKIGIW